LKNLAVIGIVTGAHRYYTHRSFTAKLPLKIFLMLCFTSTCQRSLKEFVRIHRIHHKFTDTAADPHNSTRGFLYTFILWTFLPKTPELKEAEKNFDSSDLDNDPIAAFHNKWYVPLAFIFGYVLPTIVPMMFWSETFIAAFCVCFGLRVMYVLDLTNGSNSVVHLYGNRPYNQKTSAKQNTFVSFFTMGDGGHNYHHTFPWDYRSEEYKGILGYFLNENTMFIDICAKIGFATDLKTAKPSLIDRIKSSQIKQFATNLSDLKQQEFKEEEACEKIYKNFE
jgi:stearoyl-CoA desaturase (Delta-9 desaturase)